MTTPAEAAELYKLSSAQRVLEHLLDLERQATYHNDVKPISDLLLGPANVNKLERVRHSIEFVLQLKRVLDQANLRGRKHVSKRDKLSRLPPTGIHNELGLTPKW
jgi:hypothetical protein